MHQPILSTVFALVRGYIHDITETNSSNVTNCLFQFKVIFTRTWYKMIVFFYQKAKVMNKINLKERELPKWLAQVCNIFDFKS